MKFAFICTWLLSCCLVNNSAWAIIEEVVLKWNPAICTGPCNGLISQQLNTVAGIDNIEINASAGVARLKWQPNAPFSYTDLNTASRTIGVRLNDIRVRVIGTIEYAVPNYYLASTGDNTRFLLIGPPNVRFGQYLPRNIASYPLPPSIIQQLSTAQTQGQSLMIEGPLFGYERHLLILITEQVKKPPKPRSSPVN